MVLMKEVNMWHRAGIAIASLGLVLGLSVPMAFAQSEDDLNQELMDAQSREAYLAAVAKLSPQERRDRAVTRVNSMKKSEKGVEKLRKNELKEGQEISKINCINDKLSLIKGHINVSEKAYISMDEATKSNDTSSITHHYTLIAVSYQKVNKLAEDAGLCVGKQTNVTETGDSSREEASDVVDVEPVLPGGYTQLEDIFGDIYDTTGLTPLR